MRTTGVIAEYNPFHKGHEYHLKQTREQTGADFVCVVMSGNFVQRGAPAIIDKYSRTRMALEGGADAVFELPTVYATASAELFSEASITFFEKTGAIDSMCFGSESASLSLLSRIARILNDEPEQYRTFLRENLKEGSSYPRASYAAITRFLLESDSLSQSTIEQAYELSSQLSFPNNILAIEYLKALQRKGSRIQPFCVERKGNGYHNRSLSDIELVSANAIRDTIEQAKNLQLIRRHVPETVFELISASNGITSPISEDDLSAFLEYCILTDPQLDQAADMTKDLALRIKNLTLDPKSFTQWAAELKTKNITRTHINRALLHAVLRITKDDMIRCRQMDLIPYARLLGFRKDSAPLLSQMKECSQIPIISKVADAKNILSADAMWLFEKDLQASELYRRLVYQKYHTKLVDDYRAGVVIV